ncbi:CDK-activating kinase assembly factor MAT1-like [Styela clava]
MEDLSCPRCRMTKYRNPSLRLMINVCGHALCEACVDLLFVRESGSCPECGLPLRRSGFRTQLFEDTGVDKEVDVRKQIMKIYNKQETDFGSLREYNDYLEEVEVIIDSLISGINIEATRAKVAAYKFENEALIRRNQARISQEKAYWQDQIENEKRQNDLKRHIQDEMEKEANEAKRMKQQSLLDDLENNKHLTPQQVLEIHRQKLENASATKTFEERLNAGTANISGPDMLLNFRNSANTSISGSNLSEVKPYVYEIFTEDILGPSMPGKDDLMESGYMHHVRESTPSDIGGGYSSFIACSRALQDAFTGLIWRPISTVEGIQ